MIRRTACLISQSDQPIRNQAIELHLMESLPEDTALLFLSQSSPAVVLGGKQNQEDTCRPQVIQEEGVTLCRRISGGPACYLDEGTLSYALILPRAEFHAGKQLSLLGETLKSLGIPCGLAWGACLGLNGRILSTGSFHKRDGSALHHGAIPLDSDQGRAALYLTDKGLLPFLNLKQVNPGLTMQALEESLFEHFGQLYGQEPVWMTESMLDHRSVEDWVQRLSRESWINPPVQDCTLKIDERFPWGQISLCIAQEGGIIRYVRIFSDALEDVLFNTVEQFLVGCPYLIGAIGSRFDQKLTGLRDPRLMQIARDLCNLICGHIRQNDRNQEER